MAPAHPTRRLISKSKPSPTARHRPFIGPKSFLHRSSSRHSKKSLTTANVSPEDALFFQRLPEKVKRGQFSLEEQILLAGEQDTVIPDAADELLYKLGGKGANKSLPSLQSSYSDQSSTASIDIDDLGSEPGYASDEEEDTEMLGSFRWLASEEFGLTLDDYHIHVAETADAKVPGMTKQPDRQRQGSATDSTTDRYRRPSEAFKASRAAPAENWETDWAPTTDTTRRVRGSKSSRTLRDDMKHSGSPKASYTPKDLEQWGTTWPSSTTTPDSEACQPSLTENSPTYYLNPEARLKLRLFLASPSKFDEAIEFGFPSLQSPPSSRTAASSRRPSTSATSRHKVSGANNRGQTFLDDATTTSIQPSSTEGVLGNSTITSWSTSQSTDRTESHAYPIREPCLENFRFPTTQSTRPRPSVDTQRSRLRAVDWDAHPLPWGGREMTLRMTLTRSDLRADESILYPDREPQVPVLRKAISIREKMGRGFRHQMLDNDLLKLEDLRVGDEAATTKKEGGLRRFFSSRK